MIPRMTTRSEYEARRERPGCDLRLRNMHDRSRETVIGIIGDRNVKHSLHLASEATLVDALGSPMEFSAARHARGFGH
jgi:hypothetical protein